METPTSKLHPFAEMLCHLYEEQIPFNKILGLRIESLRSDCIRVRFDMQASLIGNYVKAILHGGVISSVLDATGGLTASFGVLEKLMDAPRDEIEKRIAKIGTIDLRIDYLRPGQGRYFLATGNIMRAGRRVTVTRMELHNHKEVLIAVGTGTYGVG
jgi:uncharacterized protein (TIGR00369 family)